MIKIIAAVLLLTASVGHSETLHPTMDNYKDFERATVKITNKEQTSGGTGWILKSTATKSFIVTNNHVCNLSKRGSVMVNTVKGSFQAERMKFSKMHDLCLIEVFTNLGVDTEIAEEAPETGEKIAIAGHPRLFPLMVTEGVMTGNMECSIVVDIRKCSDSEQDKTNAFCKMFGVIPLLKTYESRMATAFIAGGNSGSAVYDSKGKVVGVVFAGSEQGYSQTIMVPLEFLRNFIKTEIKSLEWVHVSEAKEMYIQSNDGDGGEEQNNKSLKLNINNKNIVYSAIEDTLSKILTKRIIESKK